MNFRDFLKYLEQNGQKPYKGAQLKAGPPASEFSPGTQYLSDKDKKKPPGAGNYDAPVQPRQPGIMGAGKGIWPVPPSPFGSGGPTGKTPKIPPPPVGNTPEVVPKQMRTKMKKK